jgi:hypothetical protein
MLFRGGVALICAALFGGACVAEEAKSVADVLKSGPQVGEGGSGGFGALFVNGQHAGKSRCPV